MKQKRALLLCLFVSLALWMQAQTEVAGSVIDVFGEPLPGVAVTAKGTATGTITTVAGTFSLRVPKGTEALVFSFMGMQTQEVPFNRKTILYKVVMQESAISLQEQVVIGYGTVAKRDLTGSVSSVSGKDLAILPIQNTASALAGRLVGVQVTTSDGAPDAEVNIKIRGGNSITQDNNPLYVVDGFPMESISNIAPTDIESIDVLKDAASTAIYGARGANGVIIVTTRNAQAGKTTVTYNGYGQYKKVSRRYDVMNSHEFVLLQRELLYLKDPSGLLLDQFHKVYGEDDDLDIYKNMPTRDAQMEMFGRDAWGHSHNVSITGGNDKTRFMGSFSYLNEMGVMYNSNFERYNASFKLNHQISPTVKFDLSALYAQSITMGAGTSGSSSSQVKNAVSFRPSTGRDSRGDIDINDPENDDIDAQTELYDPILLISQDYKKQTRRELNVNAAVSWNITRAFSWKSEFGLQDNARITNRFYGPITYTARQNGNAPLANVTTQMQPRWRTAHTLNYKLREKGKYDLSVLAGFEALSEENNRQQISTRMLPMEITPDDAFANMQLGTPEHVTIFNATPNRLLSGFGRVNYTLKNRYLFSATVRADGSSKFAPGKQWGFFPSGAFAWRISDEEFMHPARGVVDDLKFRVSFGLAGNNRIDNDMWRRTYKGTVGGVADGSPVAGLGNGQNLYYQNTSDVMINPDLKWETTATRNFGVDFALFNSRLNGNLDLYWNSTYDLLLKAIVPTLSGYSEKQMNIGETSNKGVEFTVNYRIVQTRKFTLSASLNMATNRNVVERLAGTNQTYYRSEWAAGLKESDDFLLRVGEPVGLMYGYVTDGFYQVGDFEQRADGKLYLKEGIPNAQTITGSRWAQNMGAGQPNPGSLKLKKTTPVDPNDPNTNNITPDDRQIIGCSQPKFTGGLTLNATYGGFDASMFFNWVVGNQIYNANKIYFTTQWKKNYYNMLNIVDSNNRFRYFDNNHQLITDLEQLAEFNKDATIWSPAMSNPVLHSWAIEDGSFLRINNITVGYTLPAALTRKIGIGKWRWYCTANNLYTFTKYTGLDPEVDTRTETPLTPGVDYSSYPKAMTFTVGTNITF